MKDRAKVGMIGLRGYGNMVRAGLKKCTKLELAAIWSRDADSVARSQRELPSKACDSYEALLQEPLDGVIIVNPNYLHVEYGMKAAAAGKSILIEKPLTNTVAESKQLIEAFKKKNLLLAVKHLARFSAQSRKMKEIVQSGRLGKILSVESYTSHSTSKTFPPDRWKRDPVKCPAAPLTQLGVHSIDTLTSIFGHPVWVQSHQRNVLKLSDNVDCTVTTIGFGDIIATITAHYVVPSYGRIAIYGTEGVFIDDDTGMRFRPEGGKPFEPVEVQRTEGLEEVLDAYGESLLTGKPFEVTGDEAIYAVAVAEAAIQSAAQQGKRIELASLLA
ncbi:MAG: hypothetical protein C0404_01740 [Verrucomicrobia bacterium]|nr:hypothetical protein [Verrucomicrobiota bacterium]